MFKKLFVCLILLFSLVGCQDKVENKPELEANLVEKVKESAKGLVNEIEKTVEKNVLPKDNDAEFQKEILKKFPNIKSKTDYNNNGIDDYSDFIIGAKKDADMHPVYDPSYVSKNNGYPSPDKGVCTDVVWRAMREAGYSMRSMLNADIKRRRAAYTNIESDPDPYIDFRRVKTLRPFYEKYLTNLETEMTDPNQWQPGDIIIFGPKDFHIGILSDKRNKDGFPLVFHNMGQTYREEDYLPRTSITGHFRFEAEKIDSKVLMPWVEGEDKG